MRKELKFIFLLFLLSILSVNVYGAKRYWISGTAAYWNNTANWSASSGGASGASVPGSSDTAYFDGGLGGTSADGNDTIDVAVNVKRIEITSNYNGIIVQRSFSVTIGTGGAALSGGTFSGGSASITVSGIFTISGTAFTSTSGTFSTSANFTFTSGSFAHNNGKMLFSATSTITGTITLYQLEFAPASSSTYTIASGTTLTVSNTFFISGSSAAIINTGAINAHGNITITNTSTTGTGTATITINGSGTQTITGPSNVGEGKLPNVVINKSALDSLKLFNIISIYGNWTYTLGIVSAGTSTIHYANTLTIAGKHALYNVNFSGGATRTFTIASGDTLTINGTLATTGVNGVTINTGVINAKGNIQIDNTSIASGGTATIHINGTTNQTLTGGTAGGEGKLPNIRINKSAGTLNLVNLISVGGNWTYTKGIIDAGTSTVHFANTLTITGTHSLYNVLFTAVIPRTFTITSGDTLTSTGLITLSGTANIIINTGTLCAQGNITVTNTATTATGSASLVINGTGTQTITGSGTAGAGRLPKITIHKPLGNLSLASVISVYGDWIFEHGDVRSGSSTVVLYGTANLDGQSVSGDTLMPFSSLAFGSNTRTLTGNLDVDNNLTIGTGATLSPGNDSIYCGGTWSNVGGTWVHGTSNVIFDGNTYRQIRHIIAGIVAADTFYILTFNRPTKSQTLSSPVFVKHNLTLTKGHVKSSASNYLLLVDNATLTGGSDSAYVHGPVRKIGNDAFVFPLGDTTLNDTAYHPLGMTAPSSVSDQFEATYFAVNYPVGDSLVDSLESVSQVEYWKLERLIGSSNVTVTLGWNRNSSNVQDFNLLRIGNWNGIKWLDAGATNIIANGTSGLVTAQITGVFSSGIMYVTMATPRYNHQYALLKKKLDGGYYQALNGRLSFRFDEEYNDNGGILKFNIYNNQHVLITSDQLTAPSLQPIVRYGDNRYNLNTLHCAFAPSGPLSNGIYILEVINDKNEHWYLRFKESNSITLNPCFTIPTGSRD